MASARYLLKIIATLILLVALCTATIAAPPDTRAAAAWLLLALLVLLALLPLARWLLGRADELQQLINARSCMAGFALLAVGSAGVGLLQAQGWLPLFNQLWTALAALALWGVGLMLADRPFHREDAQ
ncbi:hypothetical protein IGB42_04061 [Andreprevotia sp. IGB-42]|uniref:hypothetical protein n=1 Tax=Andreprevotia sp. IGB-42 TaxID=2497473 RepID=UPI00135C8C08|nr:hypothetical protein [Andreprevotia sp. IGB-42]KAF0811443.1 hypothetical protein IGB42_04061 [Andreprevotia sp. IGB-42]